MIVPQLFRLINSYDFVRRFASLAAWFSCSSSIAFYSISAKAF
jgi:hypothetical protein